MSMSLNFMALTEEQLVQIESGKLDMFDLREEGIAKEAGFEWLTNYFMDYVQNTSKPLADILEVEPNFDLPVESGVTYYPSDIKRIAKDFNEIDLEKFYVEMYEHSNIELDKSKKPSEYSDYQFFIGVKELFDYANEHNMFVVGWMS